MGFNVLIGTILPGGTLTNEIDLEGYNALGLIATTALTSGSLVFRVAAAPGGPHVPLTEDNGTQSATGTLSGTFALTGEGVIKRLAPYRYVRIQASAAQTNGVQFVLPVKTT